MTSTAGVAIVVSVLTTLATAAPINDVPSSAGQRRRHLQQALSGCTNPSATNYNPNATMAAPCILPGCMDIRAGNFDSNATVDDGTCIPGGVPYLPGTHNLPRSQGNTLSLLTRVSLEGKTLACGRSYHGHPWEPVQPTVWTFVCPSGSGSCRVDIPAGASGDVYYLSTHQAPEPASNDEAISRFLVHATFGPQRAEVETFMGNATNLPTAMQTWLTAQMAIPASLHRAYYRKRVNARARINGANGQNPVASQSSPCQDGARWNSFAFSKDDETKTLVVTSNPSGGVNLTVDGILRTQLASLDLTAAGPGPYVICDVRQYLTGKIIVGGAGGAGCSRGTIGSVTRLGNNWVAGPAQVSNPSITLPAGTPALSFGAGATLTRMTHQPLNNFDSYLLAGASSACAAPSAPGVIFAHQGGTYYRFDSRMALIENTLTSPAVSTPPSGRSAMSATCPSAPKTFLNRHSCARRPGCARTEYSSTNITLNNATLRTFWSTAGKFVVMIDGLSVTDAVAPCSTNWHGNPYSRWRRTPGPCAADTALNSQTRNTIISSLRANTDCRNTHDVEERVNDDLAECWPSNNGNLRDLYPNKFGRCTDARAKGASLTVDGSCWTNVHQDQYSVFDMTYFESLNAAHQRAAQTFQPTTLQSLVDTNQTVYNVDADTLLSLYDPRFVVAPGRPNSKKWQAFKTGLWQVDAAVRHGDRWETGSHYRSTMPYLGRRGDVVDFADLHESLQTPALAAQFGATGTPVYDGSEACGSPGEVANDPSFGDKMVMYAGINLLSTYPNPNTHRTDAQPVDTRSSKMLPWFGLAVHAPDQLRQRVAWALAQIYALGVITQNTGDMPTERE
jgi:hypothetical protein